MVRSWGVVSLTGAAQPWFGDVTTAAVGLGSAQGIIPVAVASTTRYRVGDRIYLNPGQTDQDCLMVDTIPSSTILSCRSEGGAKTNTHVTNTILQLAIPCSDIILQAVDGDAAAVWLGPDNTVTVAGGSAFYQLAKVAAAATPNSFRFSGSARHNVARTSDGWMIGTAADKVAVSAIVL